MFLRAMVRIFSFGERWNVPFNSAVASLNGTFHLSPHENILTIALINIHYLYNITLHYITLHYITLHYITLHYITLHYITLHYITLHYITLHYITLHYIT